MPSGAASSRRTRKPHSLARCFMTLSASSPASGRPRLCWWRSTSARSDSRK
ncbi:Uncharacterised protein [Bordetella pertussis]|nr:Uncharacterised protein [Bordetella pertussis]